MRPDPQPARTAGLADGDVLMVDVADLSDRRHALHMNPAHLAGRQAHGDIVAFFGHELGGGTGRTDDLATATTLELDVVDLRAERYCAQRQCMANPNLCVRPGHYPISGIQPDRGEDIAL